MKKKLPLFFIFLLSYLSLRAQNVLDSIEFSVNVTGDFANNFKGGIKTGYTYIGLEAMSLGLNTDKAGLWKGGTFFIHGLNAHGQGPTEKLVGDIQVLSNIEAGDYTGLFEFWYAQEISKFYILVGQHDMNSEFLGSQYGTNFINSSFGVMPSVSLNAPVSIYPVTALCGLAKYSFTDNFIVKYAAYDGNPGDFNSNRFGVHWHFDKNEGVMNIAELEYSVYNHVQNEIRTQFGIKTGTYKIGTYYHTGKFATCYDSTKFSHGNYGFYVLADQMLIPKPSNPEEGLAALFQAGFAPDHLNEVSKYFGFGIRYHGILPWRSRDFIGLAVAHSMIGNETTKHDATRTSFETAYEFTYKFEFKDRFSLQPNIQYIVNPGTIKGRKNALVALMRFQLSY